MQKVRFMMLILIMIYATTGILLAKEYDNTSYYVAYNSADKTQFALVMPSVKKVYTHQAGHILPKDLKQIDTQFKTFPTYNKGELCFSELVDGASGKDGASVMAGECYDVNFFYIQKEIVAGEGMSFILVYTPSDKVYEGLAGKAESFKVVRDGDKVNNDNSISGDDYTYFSFASTDGKAIISSKPPIDSKISIVAEEINTTITDPLTTLNYEVLTSFGIKTFKVKINNVDRTELVTLQDDYLIIQPTPTASLPFDYLLVNISLTDEKNYTYTESFNYNVDFNTTISAGFSAEPQIGYAPVEITFSPKVNAEESIQLYHWDFGDGTKSDSNSSRENLIGSPVKHKYNKAGEYKVVLTIYDSLYQPATSELIIKIYNKPPVVSSIKVSPSNGGFPLKSQFNASASDNEGIREFLWDFDNDGKIDVNDSKVDPDYISRNSYSSVSYTYEKAGTYKALLRVVDMNGSFTDVNTPAVSVFVGPEGTPTVYASAYPKVGKAPLLVKFGAYTYSTIDKWEWDFDGDGVFDYSSTETATVDHNYTVAGNYFAKLRVTNSDGLTSYDNIEIVMQQEITLEKNTDTIDIKNDQSVSLDINVSGETDTKLIVEDSKYQVVKTLLDWKRRRGTLSTTWDGTNEKGSIVPEGAYYIVLLYKEGDKTKRFDLREKRANINQPIATNIKAGYVFAPYLEPMMIEFNLTQASEVSLDVGPDGSSVTERIKTILQRQPMGKGHHIILWAGDANDGTLADLSIYKAKYPWDANYYMTGGFMNKLADNAVFVKSGVSVLNLKSDSPVYVPNAIGEDEKRKNLVISFDLTATASVTLTVNDAKSGAIVVSRNISSLAKGSQIVEWDGKDDKGKYIAPGVYRIGVKAKDSSGYTSMTQYTLQRIFY